MLRIVLDGKSIGNHCSREKSTVSQMSQILGQNRVYYSHYSSQFRDQSLFTLDIAENARVSTMTYVSEQVTDPDIGTSNLNS